MFRTRSSEMRNFSAYQLRLPRAARIFVTFLFNNLAEFRGRLLGEAHMVGAFDDGTCTAMDQSFNRMSAIVRYDERGPTERSRTARGSMLVGNEDSVNCVREHAVVTCI